MDQLYIPTLHIVQMPNKRENQIQHIKVHHFAYSQNCTTFFSYDVVFHVKVDALTQSPLPLVVALIWLINTMRLIIMLKQAILAIFSWGCTRRTLSPTADLSNDPKTHKSLGVWNCPLIMLIAYVGHMIVMEQWCLCANVID